MNTPDKKPKPIKAWYTVCNATGGQLAQHDLTIIGDDTIMAFDIPREFQKDGNVYDVQVEYDDGTITTVLIGKLSNPVNRKI